MAVKDALVGAGRRGKWTAGSATQEPPAHWEVYVGADIGVAAVQVVIAACLLHAGERFTIVLLTEDDELHHRRRVYVGSLHVQKPHPPSLDLLEEMLSPGLDQDRLHVLLGNVE